MIVYVVVQFYPWFKFSLFKLVLIHYRIPKQRKMKFKPGYQNYYPASRGYIFAV